MAPRGSGGRAVISLAVRAFFFLRSAALCGGSSARGGFYEKKR